MENTEILIRLSLALLLGMIIGTERVFAGKTAGMRTYALVSIGSALFVIVSQIVTENFLGRTMFDPLRVASQIVVGIGFLGAGMIILSGEQIIGLTTASGIWVAAGIGMAAGFGLFNLAILATALTLIVFTLLWFFESKIKEWRERFEKKIKESK